MKAAQPILWGRTVLYGLLIEVILILVFIVGRSIGMAPGVDTGVALIGSFVLSSVFAMLLGGRLRSRFLLHGLLVGGAAFVLFMVIGAVGRMFRPDAPSPPAVYWIAHALKFAGGAVGGAIVARRHRRDA